MLCTFQIALRKSYRHLPLRNVVNKTALFLNFSIAKGAHLNWLPNWQLKNKERSDTLQGSQRMRDGQNSIKISAPLHLIKIYQMRPLLARSISLDSTFKRRRRSHLEEVGVPKRGGQAEDEVPLGMFRNWL
jgi:hypothetical protein